MLLKRRHFSWTIPSKNDELGKRNTCLHYLSVGMIVLRQVLVRRPWLYRQVPTFHTRPALPGPNHCPPPAHLPHRLPLSIWVTDLNSHLLWKALSLLHGSVLFWFPTSSHHVSWQFCGQYPFGLTGSKEPCPQTLPFGGRVYSALPRKPYWAGQHLWPGTLKKATQKTSLIEISNVSRWWNVEKGTSSTLGKAGLFPESVGHTTVCDILNKLHTQEAHECKYFFYQSEEKPEKECKCSYLYRSHFMRKSSLSWKE